MSFITKLISPHPPDLSLTSRPLVKHQNILTLIPDLPFEIMMEFLVGTARKKIAAEFQSGKDLQALILSSRHSVMWFTRQFCMNIHEDHHISLITNVILKEREDFDSNYNKKICEQKFRKMKLRSEVVLWGGVIYNGFVLLRVAMFYG